ncbi:MAG: hypothetical protein LBK73_08945 [Treponema sp.]|nr:hypothetical protein [Treponema sp.]
MKELLAQWARDGHNRESEIITKALAVYLTLALFHLFTLVRRMSVHYQMRRLLLFEWQPVQKIYKCWRRAALFSSHKSHPSLAANSQQRIQKNGKTCAPVVFMTRV